MNEREAYEQYRVALEEVDKQWEARKDMINLAAAFPAVYAAGIEKYEAARKKEGEALQKWLKISGEAVIAMM